MFLFSEQCLAAREVRQEIMITKKKTTSARDQRTIRKSAVRSKRLSKNPKPLSSSMAEKIQSAIFSKVEGLLSQA